MISGGMIYMPSFMKISSDIRVIPFNGLIFHPKLVNISDAVPDPTWMATRPKL
jgi:hypothetical protein